MPLTLMVMDEWRQALYTRGVVKSKTTYVEYIPLTVMYEGNKKEAPYTSGVVGSRTNHMRYIWLGWIGTQPLIIKSKLENILLRRILDLI